MKRIVLCQFPLASEKLCVAEAFADQERICPEGCFRTWLCLLMSTLMMDHWQK